MEYIVRDVIEYLVADEGREAKDAMSLFYRSEVFEKLHDTETGLYLSSSSYVYELFLDELVNEKIV
jgi:hypothetical protein